MCWYNILITTRFGDIWTDLLLKSYLKHELRPDFGTVIAIYGRPQFIPFLDVLDLNIILIRYLSQAFSGFYGVKHDLKPALGGRCLCLDRVLFQFVNFCEDIFRAVGISDHEDFAYVILPDIGKSLSRFFVAIE